MAPQYDLIAIGESVVDFISAEFTENIGEANTYKMFIGGQVTNLAANVARLGKRVALASCWGTDGLGQHLEQSLLQQNVDLKFIQKTVQAPTTVSIISRNLETPDFIIHRGADAFFEYSQPLFDAIQDCSIVHTSAFALSKDPARSIILSLLEEAKYQKKIITFDPNYHPGIWPDHPDFVEILKRAFKFATIAKPSLDDCARILGLGKTPHDYAAQFKQWGALIVIITMGKNGVFLSDQDGQCYLVQPNHVDVTDVTGAGDAFWSGLITSMLEDLPILDAVRIGQVLAEIKIKSMGPIKSMPRWALISERANAIKYDAC